mgnify:CR=1 FL=1
MLQVDVDSQINIKSESARNILADEITEQVIKTTNIKLNSNDE